jgi:thioredoxin 1
MTPPHDRSPKKELPMSDAIVHVTDASFENDVVKSSEPVLVDFWAEWCGPCKAIAPMLDDIAKQYQGRLKIAKLNVDENQKIPFQFQVRGIPTLLLLKDGKVIGQKVGAPRKADLTALIDSKLGA